MWAVDEVWLLRWMAWIMVATGVLLAGILPFIPAPYGRYASRKWGIPVNSQLAWFLQELPSLLVPVYLVVFTPAQALDNLANKLLLAMFIIHYTQRALIFPLLIQGGKDTPMIPFLLGVVFCSYNGYLQGRNLTKYTVYPATWCTSPQFILGVLLFFLGMAVNLHGDYILRTLRKPGEVDYKIPRGGLFDHVSGANFFGETLEWFGFAMACWSLSSLAFAICTLCNIGPRAFSHHKWYQEKFKGAYPRDRKAFIPFLL